MSRGGHDSSSDDGISFIVTVGATDRKCVITRDALRSLCQGEDDEWQPKAIFWENEDRIYRVARRLVNAGAWDSPLILEPRYFS